MVAKKSDDVVSAEVAPRPVTEALNWDEVMLLAPEITSSIHFLGDGAVLLQDKGRLVGAGEFIVLDWRPVIDQITHNEYLTILLMHRANGKTRINDGSTGIMRQLLDYQEKMGGEIIPIHCQDVRRSDYVAELPDGSKSNATTFYLV